MNDFGSGNFVLICLHMQHFVFYLQANIYCINFNHQSTMLVVSSDHGTIHVFNLDDSKQKEAAFPIIPKYFSSQWSFVKFSIPQGPACICAFGADSNSVIGAWFYNINNINNNCLKYLTLNLSQLINYSYLRGWPLL